MPHAPSYDDCLVRLVNSAYGVCFTDEARRITFWNSTAERISGFTCDDLLGRPCHDTHLCHSDRLGAELCAGGCPVTSAMEERNTVGPMVVYLKHKGGQRVPVEMAAAPVYNDRGEIVGAIQMFQDMSGFMEKEQALLVKSQELQTVIESIREGVLFIDTTGRVSVYNRALCELFSLRGEDLRGIEIFSLPEDHPLKQGIFRTDRAFRGPYCWELNKCPENRIDCPEHGNRFCRCWVFSSYRTTSPLARSCIDCAAYRNVKSFLEEPKELALGERTVSVLSSFIEVRATNEIWEVIVFRDVTAEKADAVVKLAGGAAHELRQPMQAILSAVSMLRAETPKGGTTAQCLEIIRESCLRMDGLLKKLGDVAKYRVKPYTDYRNILDIDQSRGQP